MGKTIILKIAILFFTVISTAQVPDIDKMFELTDLKKGEYLAILFMQRGDCPKYYDLSLAILKKLEEKNKHFKIVGAIECFRDIELKAFKKEFSWKHYLYRDDGKLRNRLGESIYTVLIIYDSNGNKVLPVRYSFLKEDMEVFKNFYENLN